MTMTEYQAEELERCGYSCVEAKSAPPPRRKPDPPTPDESEDE
jgi:hypothetical protein